MLSSRSSKGTSPMTAETVRLRGRAAAPGLAAGRISKLGNGVAKTSSFGSPEAERAALKQAIANAASELRALGGSQSREVAQILEFQLTLLEDEDLCAPAFAEIGVGVPAGQAWARALDTQIADYKAANDEYFRARASDFIDIRDRVSRALPRESNAAPVLPEGAILVADDLAPSPFLEIDWMRGAGIALKAGSATSHVATLARARAVPMVVSLGDIPAAEASGPCWTASGGRSRLRPRKRDWLTGACTWPSLPSAARTRPGLPRRPRSPAPGEESSHSLTFRDWAICRRKPLMGTASAS
jgi:phosphotransferase system enzyme I (PtsI)